MHEICTLSCNVSLVTKVLLSQKHAITQNSSYLRTLFSMATKTVTNYTRLKSSSDGPKEPDGRIIYLTNNSIGTNGNEVAKVSRSLDSF